MSAAFTPGPWEVAGGERALLKIMATTPRGLKKSIAQVGGYGGDSRPATARLIATAPELLSFAKDIHNSAILLPESVRIELRALIAKATGEAA